MSSRRVLILPSSVPPGVVQSVDAPRLDYPLLAEALDGRLLFPSRRGPVARAEERAAFDLRQAISAARAGRDTSVYVSLSERVGLPLALLLRRRKDAPPHVLVAHHLTSARKRTLQTLLRWLDGFATVVVPCAPQERYLLDEAGVAPARVRRVPVVVDTCFWRPCNDTAPELNTVLAVGRERRDYATLTSAARAMPEVRLEIVAGSPWARGRRDAFPDVPSNVVVTPGGLTPAELRERYQRAAAVALPLEGGCLYAAGVNALLEAAAVGCPVVATQTPGLAEYTDGRPDVRTVAPGDAPALAAALWAALDGPRPVPQPVPMLDGYVNALTAIVREVAG